MNLLSEVLRVHKDKGLGGLACLEHVLNEIKLLAFFALHCILFDMIELELLRFDHNLLGRANNIFLSRLK